VNPIPLTDRCFLFPGETNSALIVRGDRSLLIDCGDRDLAARIRAAGLPLPDTVLHTQVQEEHCREWASLPSAAVWVHPESREVALRSERYFADCVTFWAESRYWQGETKGQETYTLCRCPLERPPEQPLNVAGVLPPGQPFLWEDVELDVLDLPGSGRRALGFHWKAEGLLFSGDTLRAGGFLVNFYDCERSYGGPTGYRELLASLRTIAALPLRRAVPATGPVTGRPALDAQRLLDRLERVLRPPTRDPGHAPFQPRREFGLFKQVADGLYQNNNHGNVILYVDDRGRGLCVDPDLCIWKPWEESCRLVHEQLDLLEKEAGLKTIEWALITHYHGDHVEFSDLFRDRYGTRIVATADVAALMERPHDYDYPALVPWYGFPFDHIQVDHHLAYEETLDWHGVPVTPIHTPGHCYSHTGYVIPWKGYRTVCTGDTLQYDAGPLAASLPIYRSDVAWPARGLVRTMERLLELKPDLVLGAHSHVFFDPDGRIVRAWYDAAVDAMGRALALVHDGDLMRAMTPPGYDEKRSRVPFR
jgi:glyoxylase-like metal-dependent hydrolase (beta-lactamase superfamily II)